MVEKKQPSKAKKLKEDVKKTNEAKSRRTLLNQLWEDVYDERLRVYKVNFFRGIFFGLGSALGASIVFAIVVGLMSWVLHATGLNNLDDFVQEKAETQLEER